MHRTRSRGPKGWKTYAAGAAVAASVLACTACEPSEPAGARSTASDRPSPTGTGGEVGTPRPGGTGSATPDRGQGTNGTGNSGTGSGTGNSGSGSGSSGSGSGGGSRSVPACAAKDLTFGTTLQDERGEVPKHLLITATNTGDGKCAIHHYPYIFLGDYAQARYPVDVYEDSDPKTGPLTLAPGDEAYAALLASGVPMDQYETDTVTLLLHGRDLGSDGSGPIGVDLPRKVAFDDGARVTYWTTASGSALDFVMDS
ncbi:DUF4232 domain-containing protein [Streptomyces sp. NPDC006259]|uniref:DUF4232 domain-containing protein n=1 Tax=Streptomyces sp. NPDC006259 TaxID=3364740 RepID=UPI00368AE8CA